MFKETHHDGLTAIASVRMRTSFDWIIVRQKCWSTGFPSQSVPLDLFTLVAVYGVVIVLRRPTVDGTAAVAPLVARHVGHDAEFACALHESASVVVAAGPCGFAVPTGQFAKQSQGGLTHARAVARNR